MRPAREGDPGDERDHGPGAPHESEPHGVGPPRPQRDARPEPTGAGAILLAASLLAASPALAQSSDPVATLDDAHGPVLGLTNPEAPNALRAVESALVLGSLVVLDQSLRDASLSVDSDATGEVAGRAEWFGDWQASLPFIAGGAAAVGALTEGGRGVGQAAALLGGVLAGSMANEALNRAVGRSRPLEDEGAFDFQPFTGHASFPSGHTAYVFSAAAAIDAVTEGWIPPAAAYGVATLTGLSRVYHDKHWLSDVAVGAAVGAFVSYRATRRVARWLGAGQVDRGSRVRFLATPRVVGLEIGI